ncbi:MAG: hypothetical protein ACREA3_06180 [Nitrosotalea sp.]
MFFVDEFFKGNEYKLVFILSLIIFAFWSFLIFKLFSIKTILRDYWSDLRQHQAMITAASTTILGGFLIILLSIIFQQGLLQNQAVLQFFTGDQVIITIFVIGMIYVFYEGSKKNHDRISLVGFWSKNITIFASFMILGSAFVLTPFLVSLSFVSPILQMGFLIGLLFSSFEKSTVYLKDIAGLLIIGAIISNSLALSLGWGVTADEFKLTMHDLLQIIQDGIKGKVEIQNTVKQTGFSTNSFLSPQGMFIIAQIRNTPLAVSQNYTWIKFTRENYHKVANSFDTLYTKQHADIKEIYNMIDKMSHESSGFSLYFLEMLKNASNTSEKISYQQNLEFDGFSYLLSALSTGNTEDYKLVENNMNDYFASDKLYGNEVNSMYQIYNMVLFANQIYPNISLNKLNSTFSLLTIEFSNNSPYTFSGDGNLVLTPQCKYISTTDSFNFNYGFPSQNLKIDIPKGMNYYSIPYKIRNNNDCQYPKSSIFLTMEGTITSENYSSFSFVSYRQDLN